jgi:NodT family efflux transporter outer membrane factor (OMF) lipoprotein
MKLVTSLLAVALLAGCTVGPTYKEPPAVASDAATRGSFVRATDPAISPAPGLARWWESLNDPTLTALVDDALAHSPNIDLAEGRIREAQAQLGTQRAGQLPSVSASASYLHAQLPGVGIGSAGSSTSDAASASSSSSSSGSSSSSFDYYNLGGTASWEPDLFGGTRRGVEQARANVGRRFADLADAQVSLSAQIAQAYVNLRDVQERARLNAQSTTIQERALALTRQRFAAGTASALDVERLQTQLNNTDAQNVPLGAQIDQYRNQLALLTGRSPGTLDATLATVVAVPMPPQVVPIGDPAALIAHRPDIRSAERALAAGTAGIGVQDAKRFPSIRFMGIFGLGGTEPRDVFKTANLSTLLAPQLSWSFLDFGRNRAAVRQAEAQRDQADAQYRQAVLEALEDAETSLSRFANTRQQLAQLAAAEASATRSARLNDQRVAAGTSTVIDQLDIERQRLSASIGVAQARAQLTLGYIAVQKALGLGWSDQTKVAAR